MTHTRIASTRSLLSVGALSLAAFLAASSHGQLVVDSTVTAATGPSPSGATAGDFTGDGITDLAVTVDAPDRIQFLVGNGLGGYAAGPVILLGNGVGAGELIAADIDADGDQDLAVALKNLSAVRIYSNLGAGVFSMVGTYTTGEDSQGFDTGDVDGDGDIDFGVANSGDSTASVLFNNGAAGFSVVTFAAGDDTRGVAFLNLDGDADLDLAVASHDDRTVRVFTTNRGSFAAFATLNVPATVRPSGIDAADFNGDGQADIVVAASGNGANFATIFTRTGATFSVPTNYATGGIDTSNVVAADLDCDADIDLALINPTSNTMSVLTNGGNGVFGPAAIFATGTDPTAMAGADLDADGDMDLLVTNQASNSVTIYENGCAIVPVCGNGICEPGEGPDCVDCIPANPADLNGDGVVGADDLAILLGSWGACVGCPADLDGNGLVDPTDLATILGAWN